MQPLLICIDPTISIGHKRWCLPYAGFFFDKLMELVGEGSVINRPTPPIFTTTRLIRCFLSLAQKITSYNLKQNISLGKNKIFIYFIYMTHDM